MDVCNTCAGDHGKPEEGVSVLHPLELELRAPTLCSKLNSGSLETQRSLLTAKRPPEDLFPSFST